MSIHESKTSGPDYSRIVMVWGETGPRMESETELSWQDAKGAVKDIFRPLLQALGQVWSVFESNWGEDPPAQSQNEIIRH